MSSPCGYWPRMIRPKRMMLSSVTLVEGWQAWRWLSRRATGGNSLRPDQDVLGGCSGSISGGRCLERLRASANLMARWISSRLTCQPQRHSS